MTASAIEQHLLDSAQVKADTAENCAATAARAAQIIAAALKAGGTLMLCGNGGSAADAQHIAAEFVATLDHAKPRPGLKALALTTDTSFLTAFSNDFGYENIFARQVETLGRAGDVLIGISTSGTSANVIAALKAAKKKGMRTIAMTGGGGAGGGIQDGGGGAGGGILKDLADIVLAVPSKKTALIQEAHIALGHAITAAVETELGY